MEYNCQNFKDGNVLTAECLNHIEKGVQHVCETLDCLCGDGQPEKLSEYVQSTVESSTPKEVANALKGSASGEVVALNDVSPIEHEMGVTVSRKNLCDESPFDVTNDKSYAWKYVGNFPWTLTLFDKDTSVDISGINFGIAKFSGFNVSVKAYAWLIQNGNIKHSTKNNYANNHADALNTRCDYLFVYPNSQENVNKINKRFALMVTNGDGEPTAYAPYIDDISAVTVKTYGENLYNAANWTTAPYYSFCNIGNFPWRLTLLDKDTSVDLSGIEFGVGQYSTSNIKAYSPFLQNKTIRWATKDNIATHPSSIEGKNLLCECLYIYPNTQEALNKVLQRFDIMATGVNIIPTKQAPYIEPITYPVSADGTVQGVKPIYPNTTLLTDTAGAVIDCSYNKDDNKVVNSLIERIAALEAAVL